VGNGTVLENLLPSVRLLSYKSFLLRHQFFWSPVSEYKRNDAVSNKILVNVITLPEKFPVLTLSGTQFNETVA